ncbi:hypothetical protein GS530_08775 [Rhodococcus hoagii]|nr:hypothetical protein [Prescottella equi]
MNVDRSVDIPADAKAVIIAPSLVAARFVQLTPVYTGGESMADGAEIPLDRTAVPVEWDEIKTELTKLSDALGPQGGADQGSLGNFIDTVGNNLDGNGDALRSTLRELSDTMKTLSDGRTDLFATIRNLQMFVSALSSSNQQIVQFGGRLQSVSSCWPTPAMNSAPRCRISTLQSGTSTASSPRTGLRSPSRSAGSPTRHRCWSRSDRSWSKFCTSRRTPWRTSRTSTRPNRDL